jgi:hypothetical protein
MATLTNASIALGTRNVGEREDRPHVLPFLWHHHFIEDGKGEDVTNGTDGRDTPND